MRKREYFVILIWACILTHPLLAQKPIKTMPLINHKLIRGDEPLPDVPYIPYNPGAAVDIAGHTYQDCQAIGSTGNRVALGSDGSVYVGWTNLLSWPYPPGGCHIYCNWMEPDGNWAEPEFGYQVSINTGGSYTNLDIRTDNRGVFAYNQGNLIIVSTEYVAGYEIFQHYIIPNQLFPQSPENPGLCFWPAVCVDNNNRIHIAATEYTEFRPMRLGYTRSDNGGSTWTDFRLVDTVMVISSVLDASPVSDRVVLAYCKAADTTTQWFNDIVYYVSDNGTTWDWRYGRHNITDYAHDNDSLWAYTDLDVIFDYNDYLHLIWNAQWVTDSGVYYRTFLFHYTEETNEITRITAWPDSLWLDICGAWNRPICKMNLGVREDDNLIAAIWTQFDTSDVSASGYGNGDIFMSYTEDGAYWHEPGNLTHTYSPHCFPGECASDNWATLADVVDDSLHIFYVNDKDAGSIFYGEGAATENPMVYHAYTLFDDTLTGSICGRITEIDSLTPIADVFVSLSDSASSCFTDDGGWYSFTLPVGPYILTATKAGYNPVSIPVYVSLHGSRYDILLDRATGRSEESCLPHIFTLNQNYPNPFNQSTSISFSISQAGPTKLEIFDITGALVQTLVDESLPAGRQQVTWDADDLASGTYIYKLTSADISSAGKAVLIK